MLKKALFFIGILANILPLAYAQGGAFYLAPSLLVQSINADNSSYIGVSPKLSLGYGAIWGQSFFLAAEVGAAIGALEISGSDDSDSDSTSPKIDQSYDLSVLPGMVFSENTVGYLRFAVVTSHFSELDTESTGGRIGLGFQARLRGQWYLRADYSYTRYGSISDFGSASSNNYEIGAVYTF